jgi:hypothetical protein
LHAISLTICLITTAALAQDSLADRARKVRGEATVPQRTMGRIQNRDYINDQLGITFTHIDGWEAISRGQINVNQAVGRTALGLGGRVTSEGHEFMFHDGNGQNIVLTIAPIPPGADRTNFGTALRTGIKQALPQAKISDETATLGDAQHQFQSFRITYNAVDRDIYQSSYAMLLGNYLVHFVITATSPEALTDTVNEAHKHLVWKPAA